MTPQRLKAGICAAVLVLTPLAATSVTSPAHAAGKKYANCTALTKDYKHGVAKSAKAAAKQVRAGYGRPSTTKRAKAVYARNYKSMDRDRDGTACER